MKSQAQRRLMHAAAKDRKVAKKAGVPQKVARKYVAHDRPGLEPLPERAPRY